MLIIMLSEEMEATSSKSIARLAVPTGEGENPIVKEFTVKPGTALIGV
jgi:hypothetical protein